MTDHETKLRRDLKAIAWGFAQDGGVSWDDDCELDHEITAALDAYRDWLRADAAVEALEAAKPLLDAVRALNLLLYKRGGEWLEETDLMLPLDNVALRHGELTEALAEAQATRNKLEKDWNDVHLRG